MTYNEHQIWNKIQNIKYKTVLCTHENVLKCHNNFIKQNVQSLAVYNCTEMYSYCWLSLLYSLHQCNFIVKDDTIDIFQNPLNSSVIPQS